MLDLVATEEFLGKPAGSDILEGTFTLPVLYALDSTDGDAIRKLLSGGRPHHQTAVEQVIQIVRNGGHVERVLRETEEHIAVAEEAAATMDHETVTPVLQSLGSYLVDRISAARAN
jgi:geranylgeranyl pyrophosphate synthase